MKVLLDTHIILWALTDDKRLSQKAREIILARDNEIYYSTASVWEVTIKHMSHPEHMAFSGKTLSEYCQKAGYQMLAVRDDHVWALESLLRMESAPRHNDPFDRIMLAQAKVDEMAFLTHDSQIAYYQERCIVVV